ncbi:MAG TPA: hypothetical protein VNJ12_11430, partial [Candidatus Dormibacteraeota bacterium]|nr:hypothetical protein [Candidatus Dormibacteraeota bacterium]
MRRPRKSNPDRKEARGRRTRIRIRFDRNFWTSRWGLAIAGAVLAAFLISTGVFLVYWFRFERMLDQRFNGPV